MIPDSNHYFSSAQLLSAGNFVLSTNVVDLGPGQQARNAQGALVNGSAGSNGSDYLPIQVMAGVINSSGTIKVEVLSSPNSDLSSPSVHASHDVSVSVGMSNTILPIEPDLPQVCQRYVGLRYTTGGGFTNLPITALIIPERQTNR
ncbi:MAG: hypothetical protein RL095_1752 [Verrucomicrobiota bacterium]|jgi:hypothetical protein